MTNFPNFPIIFIYQENIAMEITSHYPFVMYMIPPCFYWQLPTLELDYNSVAMPYALDLTDSQQSSKTVAIPETKTPIIAKSSSLRKKRVENDEQWKEKNYEYKKKNQTALKESRNTISNILRCFVKFIYSKQAQSQFQRIKHILEIKIDIKQILEWIQSERIDYRNYIRVQTIKQIIGKAKEGYARAFHAIYLVYSRKYMRNHFLTSSRLKSGTRQLTLSKIRQVDQIMEQQTSKLYQ